MPKLLRYSLLSVCFVIVMTAASLSLPPGFLLPKPAPSAPAEPTAKVLALTEVPSRDICFMVFEFEGERLEIIEPLASCSKYSVGQDVKV